MDFKSLMSAQIAKTKSSTAGTANGVASKYQRRSEQEVKRLADYAAELKTLEREREQRAEKKRKLEESEAEANLLREEKKRKLGEDSKVRREAEEFEQERLRRKRLGLPEIKPAEEETDTNDSTALSENQPDILDDELRTKLRSINEPAVLYDESHANRLKRFYKITTKSKKQKNYSNGPIPTTLEPVEEKDMRLPSDLTATTLPSKESTEHQFLRRQVASYLSLLLSEWAIALDSRSPSLKSSTDGKRAHQIHLTVVQDLTPLYRRLETNDLPADLLIPIITILHHAQNRKYVIANDTYLQLSIGKAAWPIGVTMVGIHERSAREKLHSDGNDGNKQAHIMADEQTRKILQSLKRCLSFAQTRWVPDDIGQLMG